LIEAMTQERLSNEEVSLFDVLHFRPWLTLCLQFLERLNALLSTQASKSNGSISLTQKRLSYDASATKPSQASAGTATQFLDTAISAPPLPLLIRATNTKSKENRKHKVKIATVVQPDDIEDFYTRYAEVCRAGMTALKKRDRSKGKKKKKATGKEGLK
jgi:signal recognition particle subunit SRP14